MSACQQDTPTEPGATPSTQAPDKIDRSTILTALECSADVPARQVTCGTLGDRTPKAGAAGQPNIIIGGQGVYVTVTTSDVNYDAGTGAFTFNTTIRNLIPQPMGTKDTIPPIDTQDPKGVRAFFSSGPTVTGGTGAISVVPDGVDIFTAPDQPYYQYLTILDQFEVTSPKTWQLNMPATVTSFTFVLLVSAEVPRPDGYIDLQVGSGTVTPPTDKVATWVVRNANGTVAANQNIMTWSSSDTTRATVDASGNVNPLRAGTTVITAISQDGLRVGSLQITVKPIRRTWTALAGTTDWNTGGNWSPDNLVPVATDTALFVDDNGANMWPVLVQNTTIGGVEVDDITPGGVVPQVNQGAFDLTATGNVFTTNSGFITSSAGRLFLTGVSQTIRGSVRNIRVTGRYSLDGNLTVTGGRIEVTAGRLQSQSFRLQFNNF